MRSTYPSRDYLDPPFALCCRSRTFVAQVHAFPPALMASNVALQWLTPSGLLLLTLDAGLVAFIAWRLRQWRGTPPPPFTLRMLELGMVGAAVVVASSLLLSCFDALGRLGFLIFHLVVAALLAAPLFSTRLRLSGATPDHGPVANVPAAEEGGLMSRTVGAVGACLVSVLVVYALVLAVGTFAVNWDSQTYRLPRVGLWLQEHRVSWDFANDSRLVFMPCNAEILMTWCAAFFPAAYPLANLPQFFGGCLTLLATIELGRMAGLGRPARMLAALVVLAMPNAFLQMATSQSDLLTSGLLNAGLVFVWRSLRAPRPRDAVSAGLALGLALGTKGSVFYWGPGLAIWVLLLAFRHRSNWRPALAAIAALTIVVGGWKYLDNWHRFGNPFAPPDEIDRVNQHGNRGRIAAAWYVAKVHFGQLFRENSSPRIATALLRAPTRWISANLDHTAPTPELAETGRAIQTSPQGAFVGEDDVSFGVLGPLLATLGVAWAAFEYVRRRSATAFARLAMAVAVLVFFGFFFTQMKLNGWNYRYFTMVAPFVAVLAGAAFPLRHTGALALALALMGFEAYCAFDFQARNGLGGWHQLSPVPGQSAPALFESLRNDVLVAAPPHGRIGVALPGDEWTSPYYRLPGERTARSVSRTELTSHYASPRAFLLATKTDVLITTPDLFPRKRWTGVIATINEHTGAFARVRFVLDPAVRR